MQTRRNQKQFTNIATGDDIVSVPYTSDAYGGLVTIGLGTPATEYSITLDPGSSNTWVGAREKYINSSTSEDTGSMVSVAYGSGEFSGIEYNDLLTLNGIAIKQGVGAATISHGIESDGVFGIGPTALTQGTLSPNTGDEVPTITDNLFSQGFIGQRITTITAQQLIFGPPPDEYSDAIYTPITTQVPASSFWGIDVSFAYGAERLSTTQSGIVDHGATLTYLPTSVFDKLLQVTGARIDGETTLPVTDSCDRLDPLVLTLGSENITVPVENYRWKIDVPENRCYLAFADSGKITKKRGTGLGNKFQPSSYRASVDLDVDFILGFSMLRNFGVVLDGEQNRVGFKG